MILLQAVAAADSNSENSQINPRLIQNYLQEGNIEAAYQALQYNFAISERNPDPSQVHVPLSQRKIRRGGGLTFTTAYKLKADLEQAEYLVETLQETEPTKAEFLASTVIPIYQRVLQRIPPLDELEDTQGLYQFQQEDIDDGIFSIYNKALHFPQIDEFDANGQPISMFSDSFDPTKIQDEWKSRGIVVIDDVLSTQALTRIRQVLLESTVWYQTKLPKTFGGYTGAYIDDGLYKRILLKLVVELRAQLPDILSDHPLNYLWAYKYDSDYNGITLHADEAAVNVNLWITPDEANLDPTSGGLVVFTVKPPEDWDVNQYNRDTQLVYEELLEPSNFANLTIPYKENRAVLFDSALFHQTDHFQFQKGYTNRRINLTILYGKMQKQKPAEQRTTQDTTEL